MNEKGEAHIERSHLAQKSNVVSSVPDCFSSLFYFKRLLGIRWDQLMAVGNSFIASK